MRRKMITIGVAACVLALIVGSLSIAQPPARGERGADRSSRFDPAQVRQMMAQRLKEQLGVDDQAWKVMEPRLMKVMELNRRVSGMGGRGGMFFGGFRGQRPGAEDRGPGNRPTAPGQQDRELTPLDKATEQLRTTLENQSASPDEIKKQLTAVREAREKAKQELAAAQQELRQILTLRQEAQLVLMGQLN